MSIYPKLSEQDLINLCKLAELQKNQRAIKIRNKILKRTHHKKLAQSLAAKTKKLKEVDKSTENLGEVFKKPDSEDGNTQSPTLRNAIGTPSLPNTLTLRKRSKSFFIPVETNSVNVLWTLQ